MQFLILHGSFGSPEENWFPWLKKELESLDQTVVTPQFPVDNWDEVTAHGPSIPTKNQNLTNWLNTFSPLVSQIKSQPTVAVCHSLSPLFLLHTIQEFNLSYESGIFAAPFLSKLNCAWQIDLANETFYHHNFNWNKLRSSIPISYTLYGSNDPYVDTKYTIEFSNKLGSQIIEVIGGEHLGSTYPKFPLILELCKTRIEFTRSRNS